MPTTLPTDSAKSLCDVSTQHSATAVPEVEYFCLDDPRHVDLLREWSKLSWATIRKSVDSFNPVIYHECCFSFSRRGFAKKAGHCDVQSASVLKMPSLKGLAGPEDLHKWLLDKIRLHQRLGRRPVFPAINRYHTELEDDSEDMDKQIEYLGKRCEQLQQEVLELHTENKRLRSDNSRLLESSQSWCQRYQQSLECTEKLKNYETSPEKVNLVQDESCLQIN